MHLTFVNLCADFTCMTDGRIILKSTFAFAGVAPTQIDASAIFAAVVEACVALVNVYATV
jgi:hypothetical protein